MIIKSPLDNYSSPQEKSISRSKWRGVSIVCPAKIPRLPNLNPAVTVPYATIKIVNMLEYSVVGYYLKDYIILGRFELPSHILGGWFRISD